jgi:hypothetical protein
MCAQSHSESSTGAEESLAERTETDLPPKARQLLRYFDGEVDGECYLKSRDIAREIDLSAKEIGAMMIRLQDVPVGPTIEKWGYTNGTTWQITPR